jgi:RNA polymerase sigma-70 factor (ECF subfamily)
MWNEASITEQARAGDPAALGSIYDHYAPQIYAYLYRRLGEREAAEDLTAEVFIRMLEALDRGSFASTSLVAWLYRIAHNLVVDHYRRRHPVTMTLDGDWATGPGDEPCTELERKQDAERLRAALGQLTPDQQQVIALRFGQGLKAGQIAEVLNKPERAVRSLQHRGLSSLRRLLYRGRS